MITMKLCESPIKKGTWKVWVKTPQGAGYIRQGFAWKTKKGAAFYAATIYPQGEWQS